MKWWNTFKVPESEWETVTVVQLVPKQVKYTTNSTVDFPRRDNGAKAEHLVVCWWELPCCIRYSVCARARVKSRCAVLYVLFYRFATKTVLLIQSSMFEIGRCTKQTSHSKYFILFCLHCPGRFLPCKPRVPQFRCIFYCLFVYWKLLSICGRAIVLLIIFRVIAAGGIPNTDI